MIALGIDPGTRRIGYGIVLSEKGSVIFVEAGIMSIKSTDDVGALRETKQGIDKILQKHKPDVLAIEKLYFGKNQKTAIAVAQARGVILLAASEQKIRIREYAPNEVKLGVTGYGAADKKAVLKMVRLILKNPEISVIDDASDALALAIMAASERIL